MTTYPPLASGTRLTGSLLRSMVPSTFFKQTATPRNTTTTLANDPELAGIPLATGLYRIHFYGFMTQASTTPKLKGRWGFTGTWNNPDRNVIGPGQSNTAAPTDAASANFAGAQATGQDVIVSTSTSVVWSSWRETATNVFVTVAGNLSYQWAQSVSNASNVTLQAESGFEIRRIG